MHCRLFGLLRELKKVCQRRNYISAREKSFGRLCLAKKMLIIMLFHKSFYLLGGGAYPIEFDG